jgi:phosphopantetheinyl transferase (holo-ACP synthase)
MASENYIKLTKTVLLESFYKEIEKNGLEDFFLDKEIELYAKEVGRRSLAARWLVKKLIIEHYKNKIGFNDIMITTAENGKPILTIFNKSITDKILISISHTKVRATGMVVIEG